ncbi:MAG TPA: RtcB family protein [Actinomycetota bacterium]|nr:RtcB family protein [Actinomycetota bacterium]
MPRRVDDRLVVWGSDVDDLTIDQARIAASLPVVSGHVALMPDAHIGKGATIGSVIPTESAAIPSAVGVDIGCGMVAVRTDVHQSRLPDDLGRLLRRIEQAIPAGVGKGHAGVTDAAHGWLRAHPPPSHLEDRQVLKTLEQFGTLGSGNHFFELSVDEEQRVWLVLHSGSRGIGNELATKHIARAKRDMADVLTTLGDPDLAYFVQGTRAFDAYIADMRWAQEYAMANRAQMMDAGTRVLFEYLGVGEEIERINCHHNFAQQEDHGGRVVWITRKGAIKADRGDMGIIPGSMGSKTFIVRGKGNPLSYNSCSHGAGRKLSRKQARKRLSLEDFAVAMQGKTWNQRRARELLDECPGAYKDIATVMRDQQDLVEVVHELDQLVNYKGL